MVRAQRPRHYVPGLILFLVRPLFRYSSTRDAYVVRLIGRSTGPVLRRERRHVQRDYLGSDRRGLALG